MTERAPVEILTDEAILHELIASANKVFRSQTLDHSTIMSWLEEFAVMKGNKLPSHKWTVKASTFPFEGRKLTIKKGDFAFEVEVAIINGNVQIRYRQSIYQKKANWPLTIRSVRFADRVVAIGSPAETSTQKLPIQEIISKLREQLNQIFQEQEINLRNLSTILTKIFEDNPALALALPQPIRVRRINQNKASFDRDQSFTVIKDGIEFIIFIKIYNDEELGVLIGYNEVKLNENTSEPDVS